MNIIELFENNRANLYHATNVDNASRIIDQNIIKGHSDHTIQKFISIRKKDNPEKRTVINGISFTRSLVFAKQWREGGVIFEVDGNKIRNNHHFIQIDYYHSTINKNKRKEAEEFMIGPLSNLDSFLINIWMSKDNLSWLTEQREDIDPEWYDRWDYAPLWNHTKLKIY